MLSEENYFSLYLTFHNLEGVTDKNQLEKIKREYIRGLEVIIERDNGMSLAFYPDGRRKSSLDMLYHINARNFVEAMKKTVFELVSSPATGKEHKLGLRILLDVYKYVFLALLLTSTLITAVSSHGIIANASNNSNSIKLSIPFVQIGDKKIETKSGSNYEWEYSGDLGDGDLIRYGWNTVAIDLSYKNFPQAGAGWIQVYLNDDSSPDNLIAENGTSPLPISKISKKLIPGKNKIMLVYVNETNNPANSTSKTTLTFGYRSNEAKTPKISNIPEPAVNALFLDGIVRNFKIELNNFELTSTISDDVNKGQLKLYLDKIEGKPLAVVKSSRVIDSNRQLVEFSSKDFDPSIEIPDKKDTKLIFVLANSGGENSNVTFERDVIMNLQGSLQDIGLAEVKIVEPKADSSDLNIQGDTKFIVETRNFDILSQLTDTANEDKKGYMQIYVNDVPIKTFWPKRDFTLDEIGFANETSGKKNVQVQLVNKDYTTLNPGVKSSVTVNYLAKNNDSDKLKNNSTTGLSQQNDKDHTADSRDGPSSLNNWRIIIISLIASLIIASVLILVFKG